MPVSIVSRPTPFRHAGLIGWKAGNRRNLDYAMALARGRRGRVRLLADGSSTTAGVGAFAAGAGNNNMAGSWPTFLAQALAATGMQADWSGFAGTHLTGSPPTFANVAAFDTRLANAAGAVAVNTIQGFCGQPLEFNATVDRLRFTPGTTFDRVELYHVVVAGARNLEIYGGTGTTLAGTLAFGTATPSTAARTQISVAAGSTVLEIKGTDTNNTYVCGLAVWNSSNPGLTVINGGWNGANMAERALTTNLYSPGSATPLVMDASAENLFLYDPSAINDAAAGTDLGTWLGHVQAQLEQRMAIGFTALVIPSRPEIGVGTNQIPAGVYETYANAAIALALDTLGIPVVDFRLICPNYELGNGIGYFRDSAHPTGYFYEQQGRLVSRVLIG